MLIFPSKKNYRKYMEDMKKLMTEIHMKQNDALNSRVALRFRGKYIVKIEKAVYEIFSKIIDKRISDNNLSKSLRYQINRVDLCLFSSDDELKKLQRCVNGIMDILATNEYELPDPCKKFDLYPITSKIGQQFVNYINNSDEYYGHIYLRFEEKTQRLLINGVSEAKEDAVKFMNDW